MSNQKNSSIEPGRSGALSASKCIPQLRFPEFEGEWEKKKLGEITDLITKGTTPSKFVNEGIRFIKIECFEGDKIIAEKCLFIDEKTHNKELKRSILQENDLLFAIAGATIGKVNFVTKEILPANTNQALAIVRLKKQENRNYIYQILKSNRMLKYITDSISVGAQPNLNLEQMNNFSFFYPSLPEQTKIATFLTAVDEKLNALKKKKAHLELYKKGVMQKLFPSTGSGQLPALRFKDENGKEFPAWEEMRLEEVCKIARSGGTPTSTNKSFYNGDIPFLSISDMTTQGKYLTHTSNHISKLGLENSSSWIVPSHSLIYSMYASVGFVAINKIPIATSQAVLNLILKEGFDLEFMYYTLVDFQKNIAQFITTGTQGNLNAQSVKNFELKMPSHSEQIKISNFLSAIDEKINHTQSQIEKMEVWKKGLLQKMFV